MLPTSALTSRSPTQICSTRWVVTYCRSPTLCNVNPIVCMPRLLSFLLSLPYSHHPTLSTPSQANATTVDRLAKKLARHPSWLRELDMDEDDADEIAAAVVRWSSSHRYIHVHMTVINCSTPNYPPLNNTLQYTTLPTL